MDHSIHHDHSQMDHSAHMDHSEHMAGHSDNMSANMAMPGHHMGHNLGDMSTMMSMSFHFGYDETILFDQWTISTVGGLIGSMIGIIVLATFYEGLKYFREYLLWRSYNALQYRSVQMPANKTATENNKVVQPSMLSVSHGIQVILHIIQITLSYFLMLIFMTYNVWLCIAVVVGAACGYFLFGWRKVIIHDVTEHCH